MNPSKIRNPTNSTSASPAISSHTVCSGSSFSDHVQVLSLFLKQLQVQSDHDLTGGNLMEQQALCDWSFRALVLFDFSQPDFSSAQEVCGEKTLIREGTYEIRLSE